MTFSTSPWKTTAPSSSRSIRLLTRSLLSSSGDTSTTIPSSAKRYVCPFLPPHHFNFPSLTLCLAPQAIRAQAELPSIQRTRGISYAGAWTKYGFHEDGFTSGLRAAAALLSSPSPSTSSPEPEVKLPFAILPADRRPDRGAVWLARAFDAFDASGAACELGVLFACALAVLRAGAERLGVDLRHLDAEHRTSAKRTKAE